MVIISTWLGSIGGGEEKKTTPLSFQRAYNEQKLDSRGQFIHTKVGNVRKMSRPKGLAVEMAPYFSQG